MSSLLWCWFDVEECFITARVKLWSMSLKLESARTHTDPRTLRCSSPGWTQSLPLLRLLSRLRFRAPAASSGSGPAGKPAPPATPAPPRSPPASDRDASFSGQREPAAARAALAAAVRSTSPRKARGSERRSSCCGGVGEAPSAERRCLPLRGSSASLSRAHFNTHTLAPALLGHAWQPRARASLPWTRARGSRSLPRVWRAELHLLTPAPKLKTRN